MSSQSSQYSDESGFGLPKDEKKKQSSFSLIATLVFFFIIFTSGIIAGYLYQKPPVGDTRSRASVIAIAGEGQMCGGIAGILCEDNLECNYGENTGLPDASGKCEDIMTRVPSPLPSVGYTSPDCKRSGCSGQLCADKTAPDQNSICDWKPIYACYRQARCEKQVSGSCGSTEDDAYKTCVTNGGICPQRMGMAPNCKFIRTEKDMNGCDIYITVCGKWWYDTTSTTCDVKEFTGKYMYFGLHTFDTKADCDKELSTMLSDKQKCKNDGGTVHFDNEGSIPNGYRIPYRVGKDADCIVPIGIGGPLTLGSCDASCDYDSDCATGLFCRGIIGGVKRCRNLECVETSSCVCPAVTPTSTTPVIVVLPRSTTLPMPTLTLTPTPTSTESATTSAQVMVPLLAVAVPSISETSSGETIISGMTAPNATVSAVISPDGIVIQTQADDAGLFTVITKSKFTAGDKSVHLTATVLGEKTTSNLFFRVEKATKESPYIFMAIAVGIAGGLALGISFLKKKQPRTVA